MTRRSAIVTNIQQDGNGHPGRSALAWLMYRAARWARHRSAVHAPADLERTTKESSYRAWRRHELARQLTDHFDVSWIRNRDVVDFGCGTGELCTLLAANSPKTLVGVDKCVDAINRALAATSRSEASGSCRLKFICNEWRDRLQLEDESVDVICCFDVVEHLPDASAIAREWRRILRPHGRVWIWWSPWRAPYGHHLESLIPLPWVHLLFSEQTLFAACAMLYDDPDFVPRMWDRDPATGQKKPNKWQHAQSFYPFLNRLTRRGFERIIRKAGLAITRCETHGFNGSRQRKTARMLLPIPLLGECFVSYYIYELAKR